METTNTEVVRLIGTGCRIIANLCDELLALRKNGTEVESPYIEYEEQEATEVEVVAGDVDGDAQISMNAECQEKFPEPIGHVAEEVEEEKPTKKITRKTKKSEPAITLEDVRAALAAKAKEGFKDEVKNIINAHGADRVSTLDPVEYKSVMTEVEALVKEDV